MSVISFVFQTSRQNVSAWPSSDFRYTVPRKELTTLQSGSSYTVRVRAFKECNVKEHGTAAVDMIFNSESLTGSAVTGAHPVKEIETFPVSQSEIQITFTSHGEHGDSIRFNIYRYYNDTTPEQAKFENISLDDLPFRDTGEETHFTLSSFNKRVTSSLVGLGRSAAGQSVHV